MKIFFKILIMILMFQGVVMAQEHKETINRELNFKSQKVSNTLIVDNVNGYINVEGYSGDKVLISVDKELKARNLNDLEDAKKKIKLNVEQYSDTIEVWVNGICDCDCDRSRHRYNWNNCDRRVKFTFDFKIQVPENINLILSTVNKGDINLKNFEGSMMIKNINGGIFLNDVAGKTDVHTINGDVLVRYNEAPKENSKYYTLNGDLNVYLPDNLSADLSFKSFNGEFYTNFRITEHLKSGIIKSNSESNGMKYKIEEKTMVRIGSGGINLNLETFNGDIYVRKK